MGKLVPMLDSMKPTESGLRQRSRAVALVVTALAAALVPAPAPAASDPVGRAMTKEDGSLAPPEAARAELQRDVDQYWRAIEELETGGGAFAQELPEQLLGLGLALQRNGEHDRAIEVFKRGVHLSRIADGLYNPRQMALLRGEIESHVAIGALEAADERQAGLGEMPQERLFRMWSLHRLALTEIVEAEGDNSLALLPPLYGMLRAQYLISGFVGETTSGRYVSRYSLPDQENLQLAYRGESYKQGAAVIRAAACSVARQAQRRVRDLRRAGTGTRRPG